MAYFSNGSEGDTYEARLCQRCVHYEPGCTVLMLHAVYNYDQLKNKALENVLSGLIPRSATGNDRCNMFVPAQDEQEPQRDAVPSEPSWQMTLRL